MQSCKWSLKSVKLPLNRLGLAYDTTLLLLIEVITTSRCMKAVGAHPLVNNTVVCFPKAVVSLKITIFYAPRCQGLTRASSRAGGAQSSIREAHRSQTLILLMQLLSLLTCHVNQTCNAFLINSNNENLCPPFIRIKTIPISNQ